MSPARRFPGAALVAVLLCAGTGVTAPPALASAAHSPATAWRSLAKIDAQTLLPGDTLRCGSGRAAGGPGISAPRARAPRPDPSC
ncbi:hypothetical protein GTY41_29650 [Streptomyces sp. SID685]|uniref:hypothetical protein n=1 Tax=Streptomyces TaxID=1883 RepID=UPI00136BDC24|nr:hypothetical protein [Streptomyces sp. SID685]MYR88967.1 hypothetical protein [Streptomyces sp. SID685]